MSRLKLVAIISYIANQLGISGNSYSDYNWQGRSVKVYRAEIRSLFNFRPVTVQDSEEISNWLLEEIIPNEQIFVSSAVRKLLIISLSS